MALSSFKPASHDKWPGDARAAQAGLGHPRRGRSPPHLSGPRRPKPSFLWGSDSGVFQGAGQGGGAVSQVGRRGPSRVRLWRGFSQTLCSPGRWTPTLCLSWRWPRSHALSRSRFPSLRSPPFLSLRRSPARSRCRSEWRSRSGSRSLGRVRGCRVSGVSPMARCRVPPRSDPRATITSFPGRWPSPGAGRGGAGRSPARTRTSYAADLQGVHLSARAGRRRSCARPGA